MSYWIFWGRFATLLCAILAIGNQPPKLPSYSLKLAGVPLCELCAEQPLKKGTLRDSHSVLRIELRPSRAVKADERIAVGAFVRDRASGQVWPWSINPQRTEAGVFLLQGTVREILGLQPGDYDLLFVIGNGPLPSSLERAEAAAQHPFLQIQVLQERLLLIDETRLHT